MTQSNLAKIDAKEKQIADVFSDKYAFTIPPYQRPYAWDEDQCQTLWDDIFLFAFPDSDCEAFNDNDEYFLGSIVTYKNELVYWNK